MAKRSDFFLIITGKNGDCQIKISPGYETGRGESHINQRDSRRRLCRRLQHIFDENPVASCGIVHKDMGYRSYQLAVLYHRTAGHE